MITRKELSDFAYFCQNKYQIKIHPTVIEDYIQTIRIKEDSGTTYQTRTEYHNIGCHTNEFGCHHLNFDSAKCGECPF